MGRYKILGFIVVFVVGLIFLYLLLVRKVVPSLPASSFVSKLQDVAEQLPGGRVKYYSIDMKVLQQEVAKLGYNRSDVKFNELMSFQGSEGVAQKDENGNVVIGVNLVNTVSSQVIVVNLYVSKDFILRAIPGYLNDEIKRIKQNNINWVILSALHLSSPNRGKNFLEIYPGSNEPKGNAPVIVKLL